MDHCALRRIPFHRILRFVGVVAFISMVGCRGTSRRDGQLLGVFSDFAFVGTFAYAVPTDKNVDGVRGIPNWIIDPQTGRKYLGRFGLNEEVKVGKHSEFLVPAIIKVDMLGAIMNHRDLYKKKEAKIRIEGLAHVRKAGITRDVPIKYEQVQNIEKFRTLVGN